jgi:hypothetical protein
MYNTFTKHLADVLQGATITDTVREAHGLAEHKERFRNPVEYVLNKLRILYSLPDNKELIADNVKGVANNDSELMKVITDTEKFINEELPKFDTRSENTYLINFHGKVLSKTFTVPDDTIVILLSPTNRVTLQDIDGFKNILELIKQPNFLINYIKQPGCLPKTNNCFKYASLFYPGQKCFDLKFSFYLETENYYNLEGIHSSNRIHITNQNKPNRESYPPLLELSNILNVKGQGIYIINSCRSCNYSIDNYLTEVVYYNEYMINFINKFSKENCIEYNENQELCNDYISHFSLIVIDDKKFPKLSKLSPIHNKNNKTKIYKKTFDVLIDYNRIAEVFISLKTLYCEKRSRCTAFTLLNTG